jgi:PAS domain S-box-containing protein
MNEKVMADVLENAPVIIAFHDPEHHIVWANAAYREATGLSLDEIEGRNCFSIWGLSAPCRNCPVTRAIETGERAEAELTPQNQQEWPMDQGSWLSAATPVRDEDGTVIGAVEVAYEISERRKAEEALAESETKYRRFFQTSKDACFITTPDGEWVEMNQAAVDMFGYQNAGELAEVSIPDLYADPADRKEHIAQIRDKGFSRDYPVDLRRQDGSLFHALITTVAVENKDGELVAFQGTIRDVTERVQAQDNARVSEKRYRLLAENTLDVIWTMTPDLTFTYVNPAIEQLAGYTPGEFIGSCLSDHCDEHQYSRMEEVIRQEVAKGPGEQGIVFETEILHRNGFPIPVEIHGKVVFDEDGMPHHLQGVTRDITQRKRAEGDRERLLHDLEERVKELRCLYGVAESIHKRHNIAEVCQDVAELIPTGWHYPEITRCKAVFDGVEYVSEPFEETEWRQASQVVVNGEVRGSIEVFYVEERPELEEGPFMEQERELVREIAINVGQAAEHREAQQAIRITNQQLAASNQQLRATEQQLKAANQQLEASNQQLLAGEQQLRAANQQLEAANQQLRAAEEKLRERKRMLDATGKLARIGGWHHDLITGKATWTEALYDITQIPYDEEPPGVEEHFEYYPADDREVLREAYDKAVKEGKPFDLELQVHTAHEDLLCCRVQGEPVHDDGRCVAMRGTFQDITERKRTEEALRASEERFRRTFLQAPFPVMLHAEDGEVLNISRTWTEITGYSREEIRTVADWTALAYGERQEQVKTDIQALYEMDERRDEGEYRIRCKDCTERIWDFSSAPVGTTRDGRRLVVSMAMDVTERKRAQQALRKSETILAEAERVAGFGAWEWDIGENQVTLSDEWLRIHGYDEHESSPEDLLAIAHPEDLPYVEKAFQDALDGVKPYDVEHRIVRQDDGRKRHIQAHGKVVRDEAGDPIRMYGAVQDITDEKRREQARIRAERAGRVLASGNRAVMRAADEQELFRRICEAVVRDGGYTFCWFGIAEQDPEKTVRPAASAGHEKDYLKVANITWADTKRGRGPTGTAIRTCETCVCRDPATFTDFAPWRAEALARDYVSSVALPVLGEDGCLGALNVYAAEKDAFETEELGLLEKLASDLGFGLRMLREQKRRRQTETELARTNAALEEALDELRQTQQHVIQQERQRALSTMASGIAHDFNNALATIRGFTDLLLQSPEKLADRDTATGYLEHVRKAASNAAETVRRMRKFYRPRKDEEYAQLELNSIVEEAVSMTKPRWKEQAQAQGASIQIEKELGDIDKVQGNEAELHEMLTNLIFNAVDAMPDGGTLSLRTRGQANEVVLEVTDTGVGMSEDEVEHCFEPFFTTKQKSGTGLGLCIVRGIIKRHEGRIDVRSEAGRGTTFRIQLPATNQTTEKRRTPGAEEKTTQLNVLIVEDEDEQRELLKEYLLMDDHQMDSARDGREGLRMFLETKYDLVITDRSMPRMGGDHLAARAKREAPGTPVIMLTGFGDMMEAAGEEVDAVDLVLSKPVTLNDLREAISQVMKRAGRPL